MSNPIVITRHQALVLFLKEKGIIATDAEAIPHATVELVAGKEVIGVLPITLGCHAKSVMQLDLEVPQELRGQELTLEQLHLYARSISVYEVKRVSQLHL